MSDDDPTIDARIGEASERLVASFSHLDTEAELRAVRSGALPARVAHEHGESRRRLAGAAAAALLAGGTVAIALSVAMRADDDAESTTSATASPDASPAPMSTQTIAVPIATAPSPMPTSAATTASSTPPLPVTSTPPTTVSATDVAPVESPSEVFVTVAGDRRAVIDVRNVDDIVASFDLTCSRDLDCVVQSARVMGDTIWVAITDTEPGQVDAVVRSRVVSVSRSSSDVVEHLSLGGPAAIQSAGRGADGVLYAYLIGEQPADRQLISIDRGEARVLETGVSGFRLSDDGRHLAVSFSNPPAGEPPRFEITNLVDRTTAGFETSGINAGPAAWSPDGRYLIVDEQWEDQTAWIVDPWSGSGEPVPGTDRIRDGACFMNDRVVAHRTWSVGYGQGDAQPGAIRLTSIDTGSTVAEFGTDLFGDDFRCHPDGSISYLRRPVVEVQLSPDFSQLEPDYEAPVELVHIAPDGTTSVNDSGDLRMV